MNRIEIAVMRPQAALGAFAETWRQAEAGESIMPKLAFGRQQVSRLVRATLSFSKTRANPIGAIQSFSSHYNLELARALPL